MGCVWPEVAPKVKLFFVRAPVSFPRSVSFLFSPNNRKYLLKILVFGAFSFIRIFHSDPSNVPGIQETHLVVKHFALD